VNRVTKEDTMSVITAGSPTLAPTVSDRDEAGNRNPRSAVPSRAWALLEALAYAGALIDPSGVLAGQRLQQRPEQEQGHDRR
jgi:hypothetical protein